MLFPEWLRTKTETDIVVVTLVALKTNTMTCYRTEKIRCFLFCCCLCNGADKHFETTPTIISDSRIYFIIPKTQKRFRCAMERQIVLC